LINDTLSLVLERVMMFLVGAVFLGGGLVFVKQAFDDAKNALESMLFALMGVATGVWLCLWAIFGIPEM
jgi:hypothetical protein